MHGDGLRVGTRDLFEYTRESPVVVPDHRDREKGNYRLANAIMGGLDDLTSVAQSCAREAPCAQEGHDLVDAALCARHAGDHRQGEWTSAYGQDLDELTCLLGQAVETLADHLLERQYCGGVAPLAEATPRLLRTSSSIKKGLPRDSRATAQAVR